MNKPGVTERISKEALREEVNRLIEEAERTREHQKSKEAFLSYDVFANMWRQTFSREAFLDSVLHSHIIPIAVYSHDKNSWFGKYRAESVLYNWLNRETEPDGDYYHSPN